MPIINGINDQPDANSTQYSPQSRIMPAHSEIILGLDFIFSNSTRAFHGLSLSQIFPKRKLKNVNPNIKPIQKNIVAKFRSALGLPKLPATIERITKPKTKILRN